MFYKNNKEFIADDGFDRYIYSDVGRDVKINISPEMDDEGFSAIDYGWMRKMVTHSIAVFKQSIPWEDTSIVDTTKNVLPIRGTNNKLVVKHATINIPKLRNLCAGNRDVAACLNYMCKMLLHKEGKINSFLYTLWNDTMKQKQFCIEKYAYDESTNQVTSVTFRFVATKWNDSWEFNSYNKSNDNNYKRSRNVTITMGCDRPARVNVVAPDTDENLLSPEEQEIMDSIGSVIFGNDEAEEKDVVKHNVTIVTNAKSENISSEIEEKAKSSKKKIKPVNVTTEDDDEKVPIADLANCKLG